MSTLNTTNIKHAANTGDANLVLASDGTSTFNNDVTVNGDEVVIGDVQMQSLNSGPLAGMRNQLINGCLRVWQRGNGPFDFNNTEFTADRWLKNGNGLVRKSALAPEGFTASLEVVATTPPIIQKIELPAAGNCGPFKQGSQWTVSLWSDRDISGGAVDLVFFTAGGNADNVVWTQQTWTATADPASNGFNRYSATFTAPAINASNTVLSLYIENHATTDTKYAAIQLEPGPVATPFEYRPIGVELALCQRYYQTVEQGVIQVEAHSTSGRDFVFAEQTVAMRPKTTLLNGPTNIILTNDIANTANVRQYTCEAPDIQGDGIIRVKTNFAPSGQNGTPDATAVWKTEQPFNADAEL